MVKKFQRSSLNTIAAVLVSMGAAGASQAADVIVKIGHVAPLSGPQAHYGKDNESGARMAIDDLNAMKIQLDGGTAKFELVGEDDAAVLVIPSVPLVALHHRERDAVDELQLFKVHSQRLRHQYVDLHQRHAPGVIGAQRTVTRPLRGQILSAVVHRPVVGPREVIVRHGFEVEVVELRCPSR